MSALEEITERVLQKAAVLGKFIEAIPVAFLVVDPKNAIYMVNRQAELLFGYDQSEMIGQTVELLVPEALREAHVKHRVAYLEEPHTREMGTGLLLSGRRKNGTEFPAEISLGPLVTTEGLYVVVMVVRRHEGSFL
ncbi:MAG: PAS domain S-box protein [Candidatus Sulfotelmatobacter sp.]